MRAGFIALWRSGPAKYDEMMGIAWSRHGIGGTMVETPLAQEVVSRFRTILVRYKKHAESYPALLHMAAAIVTFRKINVIEG